MDPSAAWIGRHRGLAERPGCSARLCGALAMPTIGLIGQGGMAAETRRTLNRGGTMSRLHALRNGAFRRDERLKASIADIVAASFDDDVGRLEFEFEGRDTLYFLQDERGEVL